MNHAENKVLSEVYFVTMTGTKFRVEESKLRQVSEQMKGGIYLPGSEKYEESVRIWNGMLLKNPSAVAFCKCTSDVSKAVDFAMSHKILVSVRSGGHHVAGNSLCQGGLTIDLTYMNRVEVNQSDMSVRAQGGALLDDVDRMTQLYGLATPFGVVSKTGIAGLTLGGGYGHLRRKYGLTIDNLLSVELVQADGRVIRADESHYPDLLWALKGGGGNFGIVTEFQYKLHKVGPILYQVYTAYPLSDGIDVMKNGREFLSNYVSEDVSAEFQLAKIPDSRFYPMEMRGKSVVVMRAVYAGSPEKGVEEMEPLRNLGESLYDSSGPRSYIDIQTYTDKTVPDGNRYYSTGIMVQKLKDELLELMIEEYSTVDLDDVGVTGIWHTGGAISKVGISETAYVARDNQYMIVIDLGWTKKEHDSEQITWGRRLKERIKEIYPEKEETAYINFQPGENEKLEISAAYGNNYERLSEIKKKYDPENFFRVNQNIKPK